MSSIAIIGELNLDFIVTGVPALPQLGEELIVGGMDLTLGSSSAILACQLAKLGNDVLFVSKVGDDDFGRRALAFLREKGVPTDSVSVIAEMNSGLTISIVVGTERAMLTQLGTIEEMRWEDLDWEKLEGYQHLHLSSYYLQRNLRPDFARIFAEARRRGMTTSLDTGWPSDGAYRGELAEVWPHVDLFFPNEAEAMEFTGQPSVEAALDYLAARIPTVVVKLGPEGAVAKRGDQVARRAGFVTDVVDTTGAGDCFNGGFLHGHLAGLELGECLDLGNACGARSVRSIGGATAQATLEGAREFIRTTPRRV
jgi:sugar/nucleoside kinase (ribokinase family)